MPVIPFPDRRHDRRAEIASSAVRWLVIEHLRTVHTKLGRAAFELAAEELFEAVDAILQYERAASG